MPLRIRLDRFWSLARREAGVLAGFAAAAGLLLGFAVIADDVIDGDPIRFDAYVRSLLHATDGAARPRWLTEMVRDITALGSTIVIAAVTLCAAIYLLLARNLATFAYVLVAVLGGQLVSSLLKSTIERPRPPMGGEVYVYTWSFPSGHAMLSAVTYLTLGALLTRLQADRAVRYFPLVVAVVLTIAIGLSRIYLGVHWPSDVLAGWCVGAAWALLCWTIALRLQQRHVVEEPR